MARYGRAAWIATLFVLVTAAAGAEGPDISSHPMIGEAAPAFDLEEASGGNLSLVSLKGRYVVLHFGASW